MKARALASLFALSSLWLAACGSDNASTGGGGHGGTSTSNGTTTSTGTGGPSGLPCEVDTVLKSRCQSCHASTPLFGAPMPLVTYADLHAPAKSDASKMVYELVEARTHDTAKPMPQPPNAPLSAADQKTIDDWVAAGAPMGAACGGTSSSSSTGSGGAPACTPDTPLIPPTAYTMPQSATDQYICYGIDVTVAQKRHITAFLPVIDNPKIVHHIVLFQADTTQPAGPVSCGFGGNNTRVVGVWAPGNDGFVLPPEAGFPLEGTSHYLLQIHYNNVMHLSGEMDKSGFSLCTTDQLRPNDADVLAFGTEKITVPAHGSLDVTCDFNVPAGAGPYHVIGAMPHMHKFGTLISTVNKPGGTGAPVDLGTRNPWDFNTQYWNSLNATISAGDVVSTRCAWNNPGDTDVHFGENTEDEMCFSFALYYPKITAAQWNWALPSFLSKCANTP
jgi:cytochrome c551/c552